AIPVYTNCYVLRAFNASRTELHLAHYSNGRLNIHPALLQKQIDGIICTDGILVYDSEQQRLFYVYYYRNQFLCLNSTLDLLYRGNTLDTISRVKISITSQNGSHERTLATPPRIVNNLAYAT